MPDSALRPVALRVPQGGVPATGHQSAAARDAARVLEGRGPSGDDRRPQRLAIHVSFPAKRVTHENYDSEAAFRTAAELLADGFEQAALYTAEADYALRARPDGTLRVTSVSADEETSRRPRTTAKSSI